jgi:DNA-binding NtrC family response regulator
MAMTWIEHPLPASPLAARVVMHVRGAIIRRLHDQTASLDDVTLVFGLVDDEVENARALVEQGGIGLFERIAASTADSRGVRRLVLPCDRPFIDKCHRWLQHLKDNEPAFHAIVATDLETLLVLSEARRLATAHAPPEIGKASEPIPIFLEGETGTGKDMLARAIHEIWKREGSARGTFVPVHVAGMTTALINDELFGHAKGAYTDARTARMGRLEEANGGTLFIDEVGDLPHDAQVRLLRFTQEQAISRLGDPEVLNMRVRLISATLHPLEERVAAGTFRRDLFHRLRVGHLRLPPLRERAGFFDSGLGDLLRGLGQQTPLPLARSALDALEMQAWEGNLRELVSVLRQAIASAGGQVIRLIDLPPRIQQRYLQSRTAIRVIGDVEEPLGPEAPTDELVRERFGAAIQRVEEIPIPAPNETLNSLRNFLSAIPDPDQSHQESLAAITVQIKRVQLAEQKKEIAGTWEEVARLARHPEAQRRAAEQAQKSREIAKRDQDEVSKRGAALEIEHIPWMRLAEELRQLPLFAETPLATILQGLVGLTRIVYSLAPRTGQDIRAIIASRGFAGLREEIALLAKQSRWSRPAGQPARWTKAQWKEIVDTFPSQAAAAREMSLDVSTVARNLKKHRLHW